MKRIVLYLLVGVVALFVLASCAGTKRDCGGRKHYKQKGGFYM